MHPSRHLLVLVLVPLIALSAAASYYRFILASDYMVSYEGECDPATESCFEGCEDDTCETTYPYTQMQKYAADLEASCGPDITDCEAASVCLPTDRDCSITYCDAESLGEDEACYPAEEGPAEEEEGEPEEPVETL
ncbi:MAG TPA: hypothetical protein VGE23_00020 [Candidatus Paceibacterota bacterium]